jgi:hypothetical protein
VINKLLINNHSLKNHVTVFLSEKRKVKSEKRHLVTYHYSL